MPAVVQATLLVCAGVQLPRRAARWDWARGACASWREAQVPHGKGNGKGRPVRACVVALAVAGLQRMRGKAWSVGRWAGDSPWHVAPCWHGVQAVWCSARTWINTWLRHKGLGSSSVRNQISITVCT